MSNALEFPTQTSWRKQGETPKATERVFLVAEGLLKTKDKKNNQLTKEEKMDLEALKTVFSELSSTDFDLVLIMNKTEEAGKINYIEKVISTSVFLTIRQIRSNITDAINKSTVNYFFSTEAEKIINSLDLSQNIKDFLIEIIRKINLAATSEELTK